MCDCSTASARWLKRTAGVLALLLLLLLSACLSPESQDNSVRMPLAGRPRFGTWLWGRNSTGQPHWLDGSVYPFVDSMSLTSAMAYIPVDPDRKAASNSDDPEQLRRSTYDCALREYWIDQALQMASAGLDWVGIDSFGDHPAFHPDPLAPLDPKQDKYVVPSMAMGIRGARVKLRICLFDDTPSYYGNSCMEQMRVLFPGKASNGSPLWVSHITNPASRKQLRPLPVTEDIGAATFSVKWINFYRYLAEDRDLWLTHDGRHPNLGGRPVIFVYGTNGEWHDMAMNTNWHRVFRAAKNSFRAAHGVEPWIIVSHLYMQFDPQVASVADGTWCFGPIIRPPRQPARWDFTNSLTGTRFIAAEISPGFKPMDPAHSCPPHPRWIDRYGNAGDETHLLVTEWRLAMCEPWPDLVAIGHWNDFSEGQTWGLAVNYPAKDGTRTLPPDYYLRAVRHLINSFR